MSEAKTITMKLLIDRKDNKVLFAEAGKECADFFFYLLALPIGIVVKCLTKKAMVGSLGNLYDSLENLNNNFMLSSVSKECLLNPRAATGPAPQAPLLMINEDGSNPRKVYRCINGCLGHFSEVVGATCPQCRSQVNREMNYIAPPVKETESSGEGGYVKGVVTYMVMDDLVVKPMSTISSITMLNKFHVKDVGCLEEKEVTLDTDKGLALLRASLMSSTVLTDVFLGNKTRRFSTDA